ncbi:hypothetical protein CCHOA_01675 [Corynebacterium choanae]|uniref:DNA repair protein RadA n=2 Tax=Corynebacterium choanae TaxID=1862358 RepID=A0A3G6J4U6_9CORY|nr:hypothetical protein CCHOA_01675 [Corynebacterium choanae]
MSQASTPAPTTQVGSGTVISSLAPSTPALPVVEIDPSVTIRRSTGIGELDRVLGGGIVPGSVVLLAGEPGVGKSTLLLEVAARWARLPNPPAAAASPSATRTVLYITAEESVGQVRLRAERTDTIAETLYLASEADLEVIFGHVDALHPSLVIVDSVQTVRAPGVEGTAGGLAQTRAVTAGLTALAKRTGIPIILVGHVTKEGNVAGPRVLEHLVDAVFNFEGDKHSPLRLLRSMKNRYGATDEVGCFTQTDTGIVEVPDPSGLFLSSKEHTPDGSCITVCVDGNRPLLAEVQALVVGDSKAANPRRAVTGLDNTRVPMILAVLQARAGLKSVGFADVYVATVGGMKVTEPACDLAIALAIASAAKNTALPQRLVAFGEIGLAGEIRPVPDMIRRIKEAQRLGYRTAVIPNTSDSRQAASHIDRVIIADTITAAISQLLGGS